MNFGQSFRLAIKSLSTSKARAILTMLGIIIGVAAVIIIISLGDGMQNMVNEQFESVGTNLLMVNVFGRGSSRAITDDDMFALAEKYPEYIAGVSPQVSCTSRNKIGTEVLKYTTVCGVAEQYGDIRSLKVADGRFLQYADVMRMGKVCVIGSYVNEEFFGSEGLGQTVRIAGSNYTVVGVLEEKAGYGRGSDDDYIYIPYTNAQRINKNANTSMYYISAADSDSTSTAKWLVENKLQSIYGDSDAYMIVSMSEMMDMMSTIQDTLLSVLVAIAGISLLVGGIGIMNIMLVTVTERTREIGVRRSLGAQRSSIVAQFLIESGMLCGMGGLVGIAFGTVGSLVLGNLIFSMTIFPALWVTLAALGLSVALGVLFGSYPAAKAARLQPVEALRAD